MSENISNIRFKLNEANYFLDQMKNSDSDTNFYYDLDAFIVSARSILWVMKYEYLHKTGFKEWYDSQELNLPQETLAIFNTRRVEITKKAGNVTAELRKRVSKTMTFIYDIESDFSPYPARATAMTHDSLTSPPEAPTYAAPATATARISQPSKTTKFKKTNVEEWHFSGTDESAIEACQRYYYALAGIVNKCESKFAV